MSSQDLSKRFLDVIPQVMQTIREEMRDKASSEFTIPQFRVMAYLRRNPNSSNNDVADHIGVTPPTMSRLVDNLVQKRMVVRIDGEFDRRQIRLSLSPKGEKKLEELRGNTRTSFQKRFQFLEPEKQALMHQTLDLMEKLFE